MNAKTVQTVATVSIVMNANDVSFALAANTVKTVIIVMDSKTSNIV